eukprot:gene17638-biopygen18906
MQFHGKSMEENRSEVGKLAAAAQQRSTAAVTENPRESTGIDGESRIRGNPWRIHWNSQKIHGGSMEISGNPWGSMGIPEDPWSIRGNAWAIHGKAWGILDNPYLVLHVIEHRERERQLSRPDLAGTIRMAGPAMPDEARPDRQDVWVPDLLFRRPRSSVSEITLFCTEIILCCTGITLLCADFTPAVISRTGLLLLDPGWPVYRPDCLMKSGSERGTRPGHVRGRFSQDCPRSVLDQEVDLPCSQLDLQNDSIPVAQIGNNDELRAGDWPRPLSGRGQRPGRNPT